MGFRLIPRTHGHRHYTGSWHRFGWTRRQLYGLAAVGPYGEMLQLLAFGIQTLKGTIMRKMFSGSIIGLSIAGAAVAVILSVVGTQAQGSAASDTAPAAALKAPWGEPDPQASGPMKPTRRSSARRSLRTRNSSPRPSEQNWTNCDRPV
jgi:hypothetical protein